MPTALSTAPDDDACHQGSTPVADLDAFVGRNFLLPGSEDGQRLRATIVNALDDHDSNLHKNSSRLKFTCMTKEDAVEETFSCNELLTHLNDSEEHDVVEWKSYAIATYEGPLAQHHPNHNNSLHNVCLEWETGETTSEPLSIIGYFVITSRNGSYSGWFRTNMG